MTSQKRLSQVSRWTDQRSEYFFKRDAGDSNVVLNELVFMEVLKEDI
jgi:hypothetical protein